jgi:hypothetical protein
LDDRNGFPEAEEGVFWGVTPVNIRLREPVPAALTPTDREVRRHVRGAARSVKDEDRECVVDSADQHAV